MQVWDPRNQQLGTIRDVIVDYEGNCPTAYYAVAPQGTDGFVIVPFDVVHVRYDDREHRERATLDITMEQFRTAPRLEGNNWDRIQDRQFLGRSRQFYHRTEHSAARPITSGQSETQPGDRPERQMPPGQAPGQAPGGEINPPRPSDQNSDHNGGNNGTNGGGAGRPGSSRPGSSGARGGAGG